MPANEEASLATSGAHTTEAANKHICRVGLKNNS